MHMHMCRCVYTYIYIYYVYNTLYIYIYIYVDGMLLPWAVLGYTLDLDNDHNYIYIYMCISLSIYMYMYIIYIYIYIYILPDLISLDEFDTGLINHGQFNPEQTVEPDPRQAFRAAPVEQTANRGRRIIPA